MAFPITTWPTIVPSVQPGPAGIPTFDDWPTMPTPQPVPVVAYDQVKAEYGGVIPISMGTRRMPGQVVWASPVYGEFPDVYVDLGVSYGYNGDTDPSETEIARIWADGALIWRAGTKILPGSWAVTNYRGTTTQAADPLYVSDVGSDNATAFRGQLLSFFRGIPLQEFGYQIPGISAEIAGALSETPSDTSSDYAVVRFTYVGLNSTENFLNSRVTLWSTEPGLDGTDARVLFNDDGAPYLIQNGFHASGSITANEVQSYYIDLGAIRADFPDLESVDVEIRAAWWQHSTNDHDVGWSLTTYDGAAPVDNDSDYEGQGTELNSESGTFTLPSGSQSVTKTIVLRDTTSGGSVIDAPDAITIQAFLERAAEYAGLDPDTDLTFGDGTDDTVVGGLLHEEETFGNLAQRVCRYAGWEMFESDTIKFVKPVQAGGTYTVNATIPAADLNDLGDHAISTHRRPDSDSPLQMGLHYIDSTQQYKYNTQRARRILYPTRTTQSRRKDSFAVPLVITASEALSRAAQAMFREVAQNVVHTFALPPEYLYIEPGDILDITAGDTSYEVKVHKVEIGPNLALRVTVVNLMTDEDIELEASSGTPLDPYRGEPLPIIEGTMAATDGADDFDAGDQVNNANFTDGADGFSATGTISTTGTMSGTEGADSFAGSGTAGVVVTWNPADKSSANITLSGGDLTATYTAGSGLQAVNATQSRSTGKYVFAIDPTALSGSGTWLLGLRNNGAASAIDDAIYGRADGGVRRVLNGAATTLTSVATYTASASEVMVAVDLDAGLFWIRVDSGNWNNSGTANPATGTEGRDFSALGTQSWLPFWSASTAGAAAVVGRFAASDITTTIPSGFSAWG